ncbi:conserved protein of unknown function [Micropruina glycogenica]|uniref:Zinc-ribbon domain-containing protein n=1 Tax=Micropruina glycogenica TaxID=75385 RepID=A0A2N9JCJ7_9ACTN|nr:conserved protein of unknown function [Micropruina glycogenica]
MRLPTLQRPHCAGALWLESLDCADCGSAVMLDPDGFRPLPLDATSHRPCDQREWQCNWAVRAESTATSCYSCRLTRRSPAPDDLVARAKLAATGQSKRRLLHDLAALGLPVVAVLGGCGRAGLRPAVVEVARAGLGDHRARQRRDHHQPRRIAR